MPMAVMVTTAGAGVTAGMTDGMVAAGIRVSTAGLDLEPGYIPVMESRPEFMDLLHTVTTKIFRDIGKDDGTLMGKDT
jgi:hypothetical protein